MFIIRIYVRANMLSQHLVSVEISSALFNILFLLMFTIGGSTGTYPPSGSSFNSDLSLSIFQLIPMIYHRLLIDF